MAAVKSGKHIYINGAGNTLASVASDINDVAYCEWDAPSKTLTVYGTASNIRYFRIRDNGVLTLSDGETLAFHNATTNDTRLYVDAGGHLILNDACTINGAINGVRPYYWYFYGRVTCNADIPNNKRPTLMNFHRGYIYETSNNNNYVNDICDFTGALIAGSAVNNGTAFYFTAVGKVRPHIFKDMVFDETIGSNLDTYAFNIPYGIRGMENVTFENIRADKVERLFQCSGGAPIKTKGCTVVNQSASWSVLHYSSYNPNNREFRNSFGHLETKPYGQAFAYHEDLTLEVGNNNNKVNVSYGGRVLFKNLTNNRTSGDSLEVSYNGFAMLWGSHNFADSAPFDVFSGGEIAWVFKLDLTITDENGDPVEDAIVHIKQFEGRESFTFTTDNQGKLHNIHNLQGAILTHRSQYTATTGIQVWSSASTPHLIQIFKEGYEVSNGVAVMDQDRQQTVQLVKNNQYSTIIETDQAFLQ